jgi:hypothetical protein
LSQTLTKRRLFWGGCFFALTLLYLLPLWLFPYIPTSDGPTHLEAAQALRTLAEGNNAFFNLFYSSQWRPATNQVYHLLLVTLGRAMPVLVAEKVLLSAYVVLFLTALVFALRGLRGGRFRGGLSGLPGGLFLYLLHRLLQPLFRPAFFLLALGLYFRLAESTTARRTAFLAAALTLTLLASYFVHVIAAASTLLALGVMVTLGLFRRSRHAWRSFWVTALAATPAVLLILYFIIAPPRGAGSDAAANTATDFLSFSELLRSFFVHPPEFLLKAFVSLVVHSWVDVLFTLPWNLLLVTLALLAARRSIGRRALPHGELLGALGVFLFIIVWTPTRLGEGGWLTERFLPFGYLLLVLWLAGANLSPRLWRYAAGVGVVLAGALMAYRIPLHAMLVSDIQEYVDAAAVIENDATVLPLNLASRTVPTALSAMVPELRYDALGQAVGYVALERQIVNLRNYQAAKGYFPLIYKEARNPALFLSEKGYNGLGQRPFAFNLEAYRQETGVGVDYVLIWGDLGAQRGQPDIQNVLAQLSDYKLIYTSEPRGLMHVYALSAP